MKERVLIIVDVQNDFCPGGSLSCPEGENIIDVINNLLKDDDWDLVVATQDWHPAEHCSFASSHVGAEPFTIPDDGYPDMVWPVHCVAGTFGADINASLDQEKVGLIVRKGMDKEVDSYSAYMDNNGANPSILNDLLIGTNADVFVCGIATDVCVKNTAMDAMMPNVTVHVISDACSGVTEDGHRNALAEMEGNGIRIVTSKELIRQ